jgi:hypothetical protein
MEPVWYRDYGGYHIGMGSLDWLHGDPRRATLFTPTCLSEFDELVTGTSDPEGKLPTQRLVLHQAVTELREVTGETWGNGEVLDPLLERTVPRDIGLQLFWFVKGNYTQYTSEKGAEWVKHVMDIRTYGGGHSRVFEDGMRSDIVVQFIKFCEKRDRTIGYELSLLWSEPTDHKYGMLKCWERKIELGSLKYSGNR